MESPQPEEVVKKPRGRPRKVDLTGTTFERASSTASSAPPTPAIPYVDPLAADEVALFGIASADETLPVPPGGSGGFSGNGAGKRTIDHLGAAGGVGRAKRPKNVKFSPAKGSGKTLARRAMPTATGLPKPFSGSEGDPSLPNNDFCDACNGKGQFLCCDGGCLRSFHFSCLEPPLDTDDVPEEDWYCKACSAARDPPPKPPRGFFRELIHRIDVENPKAFSLTPEIKNSFLNVATGPSGEFIDSTEHRPPSKVTGRGVGQEDRDGYRLKDRTGHTILCYKCNQSASIPKQRRILSCDFCDMHWHLDCLDPPMTGMPPPTRKWMCPVHSDLEVPKKRLPKQTTTINVTEPYEYNNGDIVILPRREPPRIMEEYEEIVVNRVRYQVPEEIVILDFWGRVQSGTKFGALPPRNRFSTAHRDDSPLSMDSPLTSLGDLSDADPPEVVEARQHAGSSKPFHYAQPHYHPHYHQPQIPSSAPDCSALNALADLAEGILNGDEPPLAQPPEPFVPLVDRPAASSAPRASANGLIIKFPSRPNGPNGGSPLEGHDADAVVRSTLDKGKGKARDGAPRHSDIATEQLRHRQSSATLIAVDLREGGAHDSTKNRLLSTSRQSHTPAVSTSALQKPRSPSQSKSPADITRDLPLHQSHDGTKSARGNGGKLLRHVAGEAGPSVSPPPPSAEISVQSKDDLKALMHVRKLLSGENIGIDRKAFLGFIEGEAIVPKLAFIREDPHRQPWALPWEGETAQADKIEIAPVVLPNADLQTKAPQ